MDKIITKEYNILYNKYKKSGSIRLFTDVITEKIIKEHMSNEKSEINSHRISRRRLYILLNLDDKVESKHDIYIEIRKLVQNYQVYNLTKLEEICELLRIYSNVSDDERKDGDVMTDLKLVKDMLNLVDKSIWSNKDHKFFDPGNGSGAIILMIIIKLMEGLENIIKCPKERYKHIIENQIYVSEKSNKNMFMYLVLVDPYDIYNHNIYSGDTLSNDFQFHLKNVWRVDNFTLSVANPPFNNKMDMKFFNVCYDISDKVLFLHPATWLLDEKNICGQFNVIRELLKEHLDKIILFNGNKILKMKLFVPCSITYINKQKTTLGIECLDKINSIKVTYDNIYQINKYSNIDIYSKIKEKILSKTSQNLYNMKEKSYGRYIVNISKIRGNVNKDLDNDKMLLSDFYTMVTKNTEVSKNKTHQFFCFNTNNEAKNFLDYTKSDFARFCLAIYKNNQNLHRKELSSIPWLDFSKSWSDTALYNKFNITTDEINFIKKTIPNYY